MLSIRDELLALVRTFGEQNVPYALCGALALAAHGYPRATLDIDLLSVSGSGADLLRLARTQGYTLAAAPMAFQGGRIRIDRISKSDPDSEDFLSLDILTLAPDIERSIEIENRQWEGVSLAMVTRDGLKRLKSLRNNAQDLADIERLNS